NTTGADGQAPQTDENGGERRERRSRDRYGRDRRERGDRAPRDEGSAEHADNEQAPQEASDTREPRQPREPREPRERQERGERHASREDAPSAAPVAQVPARAGMPLVQAFTLPVADMQAVAQGSGLEWVNSNPERIAAVQAAIAAEPKPVHVPRERPPLVILDEGPLILVETRKDL
ncbi:MAG: ribonuclease E/G, partial [Limnohabitans sp.]